MQKTLESFIDPINIPKKYGGQLDFHFGDMPILDPVLEKVLTWEGTHKNFGQGPMYWVQNKGEKTMQLIARGSVDEKERDEVICTVKKTVEEEPAVHAVIQNGHAAVGTSSNPTPLPSTQSQPPSTTAPVSETAPPLPAPGSELLTAPTVPPSPAASTANLDSTATAPEIERETQVVQQGEVVPASRPEPTSFVTATEGLSLSEKTGNLPNGKGPHTTAVANLLDPVVNKD